MPLFEINHLSFRYPALSPFSLRQNHFSVEKGNLIGLLGPNGAGKSTLLKIMAGLLTENIGNLNFEGLPLRRIPARERARKIAYVPQSARFTFPLSVWEIVEMGRYPFLGRFEAAGKNDKLICEKALKLCDALDFKDRFFEELSGGERQRVLLASALAQTPDVLLLDEPTLSLDLSHQILFFELIRKLHREEGLTVVVATHELNLAGRYLERLLLMKDGKIMADGSPDKTLTRANIKSLFNVEVEPLKDKNGFSFFVPLSKQKVNR